jgi:hypothetical protein
MQKPFRRFELLLPTRFNSGVPVPAELFADTLLELEDHFGAVSSETQRIEGRCDASQLAHPCTRVDCPGETIDSG